MYATNTLRSEHEDIRVVLAVLKHMADDAARGIPIALDDATDILEFLRTFVDQSHFAKEELLFYPAVEAAGVARAGGPIEVMMYEHLEGRTRERGMADALERLRAGVPAGRTFAHHAKAYVRMLRDHIHKENVVIFPVAEKLLSPDIHEQLLAAFARIDADRLQPGAYDRSRALVERLRLGYLRKTA